MCKRGLYKLPVNVVFNIDLGAMPGDIDSGAARDWFFEKLLVILRSNNNYSAVSIHKTRYDNNFSIMIEENI